MSAPACNGSSIKGATIDLLVMVSDCQTPWPHGRGRRFP